MVGAFIGLCIVIGVFYFYLKAEKKAKQAAVLPKNVHTILEKEVTFYKKLSAAQKKVFLHKMQLFLQGVTIEGVKTVITTTDRVFIAASAVIPVFYFTNWHYPNLTQILVYPDTFSADLEFASTAKNRSILGMVGTGRFKNTMILSQKALRYGFTNSTDRLNTAIHEFVHLLDGADLDIDGIPNAILEVPEVAWLALVHKKMEQINTDASDIRSYGGTSLIEFFAVASEYFFSRPDMLKQKHPDLYQMLSVCFQTPDKGIKH